MQRHPTSSATRTAILKASEIKPCPSPFRKNTRSYGNARQQNQQQFVWRKPTRIFRWEGVAWHTCGCESEVSNDYARSPLIDCDISHTDRVLLPIRPRMPPEIVIER